MSQTPDSSIIDLSKVEEMFPGDAMFRSIFLTKIQGQLPEMQQEMEALFEKENWNEMGLMAHKYKSTVTYLGNPRYREVLQAIESYGRSGSELARVPALIQESKDWYQKTLTALENLLNG